MALADIVQKLQDRLDTLETKLSEVEEKIKESREVKQVVFDKEGDTVKVRAKVFIKRLSGSEEKWEDVTGKFTDEKIQEVLNGA